VNEDQLIPDEAAAPLFHFLKFLHKTQTRRTDTDGRVMRYPKYTHNQKEEAR